MCKNTEREIMKFILFVLLGFTLSQVAFSASIPKEEEEEDWTDADFSTDDEDEEQEIDGNVEQANNAKEVEDLKSSEKDGRKSDSSSGSDPSASTNDLNPKSAIQTDNLKPNSGHQAEIEDNEDSELEGSDVEEEEEEEEEKEKGKDSNIQVDNENSDYKDEKDNKEKPKLVVNSFENTGEKSQNIDPSKSSVKGNLKNVNREENEGDEKKKKKVEKSHTDTGKTDHNDAKDDKENPKLAVDPSENTEKESQHADPTKSSVDENPKNVNVEDELGEDDDNDEEENEGEKERNGKNEKEERERPDQQKKETEKDQIQESANESSKSAMENSSSNEDPNTINEDVNEENKKESSKDQDEEIDEDDIDQEDDEDEVQESNESSNLKKEELNSETDTISQLPSNPKTDSATPSHTNLKEETEENKDEKDDNEDPKSDKKTAISDKEISETKNIDTQSILTTSKSENSTPSTCDHVTDDVTKNSQDSKDKLTADEDKTPSDKEKSEGLAEEDENDDEDLEKAEEVPEIKLSKMKKGNKTKLNKPSKQRNGNKENAKNRDTTIEPLQQDSPNSLSNKDDVNNKTIPKDFETIELISSTKQFLIQEVPKLKQKNVFPQKPTKYSSRPSPTSKVSNDKQSFVLFEWMNKTPEKFSPPPSRFGSFKGSSRLSSSSSFNSSKKTKADVVDKFYESLDEMTDLYHQVSSFPTKAQSRSAVQQIFGPTGKIPSVDLQPKNLRTPSKNFKSNNSFSLMSSNFENLFTQKSSSPFMPMNGSMWF